MIKIPATLEGIPAIEETIAAGINVNVTLIFSLDRHDAGDRRVPRRARAARRRAAATCRRCASVASFFVSRVDTETDRRLPEGSPLRGKAAVANAKLAYQLFRERFSGPRWDALAAKGARLQRPLWASTSTKNPAYSATLYVDELIGPDTVNTLAPASIDALQRGEGNLRADTVTEDVDDAHQVIADLAAAGVDFDDVTDTLEREGVDSFAALLHRRARHPREAPRRSHRLSRSDLASLRVTSTASRRQDGRRARRRRGGGRRARSSGTRALRPLVLGIT